MPKSKRRKTKRRKPTVFTAPLGDETFSFKRKLSDRELLQLYHLATESAPVNPSRVPKLEVAAGHAAAFVEFVLIAVANPDRDRLVAALTTAEESDLTTLFTTLTSRYVAQLAKWKPPPGFP